MRRNDGFLLLVSSLIPELFPILSVPGRGGVGGQAAGSSGNVLGLIRISVLLGLGQGQTKVQGWEPGRA